MELNTMENRFEDDCLIAKFIVDFHIMQSPDLFILQNKQPIR